MTTTSEIPTVKPVTVILSDCYNIQIRPNAHLLSSVHSVEYEYGLHLGSIRDILIVREILLKQRKPQSLNEVEGLEEKIELVIPKSSSLSTSWTIYRAEFKQDPVQTLKSVKGRIDQWYVPLKDHSSQALERVCKYIEMAGKGKVSLYGNPYQEIEQLKDFARSYGLNFNPSLMPTFPEKSHYLGLLVKEGERCPYFLKPERPERILDFQI